jgi:hypothetical protein
MDNMPSYPRVDARENHADVGGELGGGRISSLGVEQQPMTVWRTKVERKLARARKSHKQGSVLGNSRRTETSGTRRPSMANGWRWRGMADVR